VNAHRRELKFNPGDLVLLSTKNLRQPGPGVRKLKPLYMGPFEVDSMLKRELCSPRNKKNGEGKQKLEKSRK
jgi:hypothetical protein